jgi:hypothetical protein
METILWTVYLSVTLILTVAATVNLLNAITFRKNEDDSDPIVRLIICVLWAIWIMYK